MQLHALTRVRECSLVSKGTCTWAAGGHEGKDGSKPALFSSPGQYTIQNNRASIIGDDRGRIALSWSGLTAVLEVVTAIDLYCVTRAKIRVPLCTKPYLIIADAVAACVFLFSVPNWNLHVRFAFPSSILYQFVIIKHSDFVLERAEIHASACSFQLMRRHPCKDGQRSEMTALCQPLPSHPVHWTTAALFSRCSLMHQTRMAHFPFGQAKPPFLVRDPVRQSAQWPRQPRGLNLVPGLLFCSLERSSPGI